MPLCSGNCSWHDDTLPGSVAHLPDMVHTCLDLLIDHEQGTWHLAHPEPDWRTALAQAMQDAGLAAPNCQTLKERAKPR